MVGAGTLAVILLLKGSKRVPGILVAVVGSTVIVGALDLAARAGVSVLGSLPKGLPAFAIPWITLCRYRSGPDRWLHGRPRFVRRHQCALAHLCRAVRHLCRPQPGDGGARGSQPGRRILSGLSRSAAARRALPWPKPQAPEPSWPAWSARLSVALLLVVAPELLEHLPSSALAAVVIASAIGLIEVTDLRRIYRIQRWEFWLSIGCFVGVAVLGAIPGIGLAIVVAVIEFLWDGWRPHSAVLGRAEGVKGYHDITRYPESRRIPGLVLFRWDAPLFFANAELFHERVLDAVATSPTPARWLVVAAEPVTSVDVTAADMLAELDETLDGAGVELCFAELKDPVKDKLKRFGLFARLGQEVFFPTIDTAVSSYLETHSVDRVNSQDGAR